MSLHACSPWPPALCAPQVFAHAKELAPQGWKYEMKAAMLVSRATGTEGRLLCATCWLARQLGGSTAGWPGR